MSHPRSHIWDFDDKADKDTDAVVGNLLQSITGGGYEDSGIAAAEVKGHLGSTNGHPVATASVDGFMSKEYAAKVDILSAAKINYSGYPGEAGFPNGICPEDSLPSGMLPLSGYTDPTSPNYGNYIYSDGSIMVYRPQTFIKVGDGTNGLAVNEVDVVPWDAFATEAEANDAGYFIHDIFKNGAVLKKGIFRDKYHNSKNAKGAGFVASSIKNGLPISMHADHNPVADLTACSANAYYEAINAAHARDGVDGAVNASSIFFVEPRQFAAYMALTTTAHAQASTSDTYCAYYDATGVTNYPKGCNNNALGDTDDGSVSYVSDGYSNCGKAGSGTPFAKITDNGQECGIADVNGLMWRINIGMTCITTTASITSATQANPCQITAAAHGKSTGDWVMITGVAGMTELNDKLYQITVVDVDNFTLDGIDATLYTAYTSGGTATFGAFYKKTDAAEYEDFTSGNSLATDHWGATGVAAMMEEVELEFVSGGAFAQWFGNSTNQVLSPDITGNDFEILQLGLPVSGGASSGGTNLFGSDYFYQYIRNELCVLAGGYWAYGSNAGVFSVALNYYRTLSRDYVGFACACYPV
jgi:hypothetical protein